MQIKSFYNYINENKYYSSLVDNYGDEIRAKEEFDYYNNILNDYQKNGCILYRIIFLKNISDLDRNNIGNYWTIEKDNISSFYHNIKVDDDNIIPYLITAKFNPNSIDIETSWNNFSQLPDEQEIYTKKEPKSYKIEKYIVN